MSYENDAAHLIAGFESFRGPAYWDVNAWRNGYGSDTMGTACVPVHRGSVTTQADAIANLEARIHVFEAEIIRQVGGSWAHSPDAVKPALLDIVYNYGHLPRDIPQLLMKQNWRGIIAEIKAMESDNNGLNAKRRAKEAALIQSAIGG